MKKHTFKLYLVLGVLIAVSTGIGISQIVSAAKVPFPPAPIYVDGKLQRSTVTPNEPILTSPTINTGAVGTPIEAPPTTLPFARFSGIDAPIWLSSAGTPVIASDLVMYGLNDVHGGFINNGIEILQLPFDPVKGGPGGEKIILKPVYIFDDVSIIGNSKENGSLTVKDTLSTEGKVTIGSAVDGIISDLDVTGTISGGGFYTMGDISVPAGHFSAKSIGAFTNGWEKPAKNYDPHNDWNKWGAPDSYVRLSDSNVWANDTSECPTPNGIMLSCYAQVWAMQNISDDNNIFWLSNIITDVDNHDTCSVRLKKTKIGEVINFNAMAKCFDPSQ